MGGRGQVSLSQFAILLCEFYLFSRKRSAGQRFILSNLLRRMIVQFIGQPGLHDRPYKTEGQKLSVWTFFASSTSTLCRQEQSWPGRSRPGDCKSLTHGNHTPTITSGCSLPGPTSPRATSGTPRRGTGTTPGRRASSTGSSTTLSTWRNARWWEETSTIPCGTSTWEKTTFSTR